MYKINSLIYLMISCILLIYICKKDKPVKKKISKKSDLYLLKYKNRENIYAEIKNEEDKLKLNVMEFNDRKIKTDETSEKFNKNNNYSLKNLENKKFKFNYENITDVNNLKFNKDNIIPLKLDNSILRDNVNEMDIDNDYNINIIKKSEKIVKDKLQEVFKDKDKRIIKLLNEHLNKEDKKIETDEFNIDKLERTKTSKQKLKEVTPELLKKYKGMKIKDIYDKIVEEKYNVNLNTNISGKFTDLNDKYSKFQKIET